MSLRHSAVVPKPIPHVHAFYVLWNVRNLIASSKYLLFNGFLAFDLVKKLFTFIIISHPKH